MQQRRSQLRAQALGDKQILLLLLHPMSLQRAYCLPIVRFVEALAAKASRARAALRVMELARSCVGWQSAHRLRLCPPD
jgi:hypothetical protein